MYDSFSLAHFLAEAIVRLSSLAVPTGYRERFVEEWLSEIWHERERLSALDASPASGLVRRSLGVVSDARATRRLSRSGIASHRPSFRGHPRSTDMFLRDLRYATRALLKRPLMTLVAIGTLAVGIGANTAIFGLVHAVLVRPLSYPESDRVVKIIGFNEQSGEKGNLSPADFYDLKRESESFVEMGAHGWVGFFTVTGDGEPERVAGNNVTAGFFDTLAVQPAMGRLFTLEDDAVGAPPTVLLSHGFWQRRYGGNPEVLGKTVLVNAVAHQVIGVLPSDYRHPEPNPEREPQLYSLYQFDPESSRSGHFIRAIGRLRPDASVDGAASELVGIASRLAAIHPESNIGRSVYLQPLKEAIVGDSRQGLLILLGAVLVVLLIACVNIANLQLAHGNARRHELGLKTALGAGRGRIARQLLTESFLLSMVGGVLGVLLALAGRGLLVLRVIPRAEELSFDGTVLGFTFFLTCLSTMLFGLAPAVQLSTPSLGQWLSEGATPRQTARSGVRGLLVAAEVALSLVLLIGAGLLIRSLWHLENVAPGFHPESVLSMQMSLPTARYAEGEQIPFYRELYQRIAAFSGVEAVGAINILPLSQNYSRDGFQIDRRPVPEGEQPSAEARSVNVDYFAAMGIPLLKGRLFGSADDVDSAPVVVISEAMAKEFWPVEDPVGQRITYNRGVPEQGRQDVGGIGSREIVGIVGNVKHLGLDDGDVPMFYTPQAHHPSYHTMTLVIRARAEPSTLTSVIREELRAIDKDVPLYGVRTLGQILETANRAPRFRTLVFALFAGVALLLALVGVYAVMRLMVAQRTQEIGIRLALGAGVTQVVKLLVLQSMRPVFMGIGLGLLGALAASRFLSSLLFEVPPTDPWTFAAVAVALVVCAFCAALLPTLRATRIDPVETLRME